jgi:hypothetical protein
MANTDLGYIRAPPGVVGTSTNGRAHTMRRSHVALILAAVAAVAAWIAENAAIHAMGYSGFGGAGWITAIVIPLGAGAWVYETVTEL